MATSVEDLVNQVARVLGVRRRINWIYEGSELAKAALEVYGQTRDELLQSQDWPFAVRRLSLALLKGPPPSGGFNPTQPWSTVYAVPGYLYEYAYPSDAIEIRAIVPPPGLMPDRDPKPAVWSDANDSSSSVVQRVILTNIASAIAIYRARIIDPSTWTAGFTAAMVDRLAQKLSVPLAQSIDLQRAKTQEGAADAVLAGRRRG